MSSFTSPPARRHPAAASPATPATPFADPKPGKKRGSYNCGRCGAPKKGHVCNLEGDAPLTPAAASVVSTPAPRPRLPRALSFDEVEVDSGLTSISPDFDPDEISGGLPAGCLWQVLKRLPPPSLLSAARVCKGWSECSKKMWKTAEELRLRVPPRAQIGIVGSVLKKCTALVRLSLTMESDLDATMLACIAFSCPNLESLEISTSKASTNLITGEELARFITDKRCLSVLKMEGCTNLGELVVSSSSLCTLWLSDLHSLSKTVFNCPNMREISLDFSRRENDATDLTTMMDNLGRCCPRLHNIHIASSRLSHPAVLALSAANLRSLRMLSLVLGAGVTDASVAAITSNFTKLELLDLSGSSISDSGIGMICNVYPHTLTRLLLALCPSVSSNGIQFATAQLPLLELMDCGMTICDPDHESLSGKSSGFELKSKLQIAHQKLIVKHSRLKKLSLWGCSGLEGLYLNCPNLNDLNLNSCSNLHSDKLLLRCPKLEIVHASGCFDSSIRAIESQVWSWILNFSGSSVGIGMKWQQNEIRGNDIEIELQNIGISHSVGSLANITQAGVFTGHNLLVPLDGDMVLDNKTPPVENYCKRMADGSKRIRVPHFVHEQMNDELKSHEVCKRRKCSVIVG